MLGPSSHAPSGRRWDWYLSRRSSCFRHLEASADPNESSRALDFQVQDQNAGWKAAWSYFVKAACFENIFKFLLFVRFSKQNVLLESRREYPWLLGNKENASSHVHSALDGLNLAEQGQQQRTLCFRQKNQLLLFLTWIKQDSLIETFPDPVGPTTATSWFVLTSNEISDK